MTNQITESKQERQLPLGKKHSVYLASPFFVPEQIERVEMIENLLEKHGYSYFSPRKELVCPPTATDEQRKKTFEGNHNGILDAEMVIAVTDGKDVGTIWEMGVAFEAKVPVIGVALTLGDKPFNLMLSESCFTTVRTKEELETFLQTNEESYYKGLIE